MLVKSAFVQIKIIILPGQMIFMPNLDGQFANDHRTTTVPVVPSSPGPILGAKKWSTCRDFDWENRVGNNGEHLQNSRGLVIVQQGISWNLGESYMVLYSIRDSYWETHIYIYTELDILPMFHYQRVLENQPSSTQLPPCSVATTSMIFSEAVKKIWFPYGVTTCYNLPILRY